MVDFNNDVTVATPAVEVKRILMLQDRQYLKEAIGAFKKSEYSGGAVDLHVVRSRLIELFLECRAGLRRHLKKDEWEDLNELLSSDQFDDVLEAYYIIDTYLDEIGLTKVDVKIKLGGNIAERNKAQGWKA